MIKYNLVSFYIKMERKYAAFYEFMPIFFGMVVFSVGYAVKHYVVNLSILYNSLKTPWGIVTALFVYDGVENAIIYAFFAILFIAANAAYARCLRVDRYTLTLTVSLVAALTGNIADLAVFVVKYPNGFGVGQSGIVYGFMGAIGAIAFFDFLMYLLLAVRKVRKKPIGLIMKNRTGGRLRRIVTYIFTTLTLLFTVIYAIADLPAFFSVAPGVDSFVHVASFGTGALISLYLVYRHRDRLLWASEPPKKGTI